MTDHDMPDGCLLIGAVAAYVLLGLLLVGIGIGAVGWVLGR